mgnify:CR=1 FL=1
MSDLAIILPILDTDTESTDNSFDDCHMDSETDSFNNEELERKRRLLFRFLDANEDGYCNFKDINDTMALVGFQMTPESEAAMKEAFRERADECAMLDYDAFEGFLSEWNCPNVEDFMYLVEYYDG